MFAWVLSKCSCFLPQYKNMQLVGFIGDSKMSVSVNEMLHESKDFKL